MNASILITLVSVIALSGCGKPTEKPATPPSDSAAVTTLDANIEKFIQDHLSANPDDLVGKDGKPVHFEMAADDRYKLSQTVLQKRAENAGKDFAQLTAPEKMELVLALAQDPSTPPEALRAFFDLSLLTRLQSAPVSEEESKETEGARFDRYNQSTQILKEVCEKLNLAGYWAVPIQFEIAQSNRAALTAAE